MRKNLASGREGTVRRNAKGDEQRAKRLLIKPLLAGVVPFLILAIYWLFTESNRRIAIFFLLAVGPPLFLILWTQWKARHWWLETAPKNALSWILGVWGFGFGMLIGWPISHSRFFNGTESAITIALTPIVFAWFWGRLVSGMIARQVERFEEHKY